MGTVSITGLGKAYQHPHQPTNLPTPTQILLVLLLAALLYLHLFGLSTLQPTNTGWLLQGDPAQHYLGWQFFRAESWQWPPGRIQGFNYPVGTTIVFTDSIPLLALLLKPFSTLLPKEFQYFGLWILACYLLSAYFGLRLLARATPHAGLRLAGACFFILSPPLLLRGYGHESLMAHWLLLAGMDSYLRGWRWHQWLGWSLIAALVHPYLLLMLLGLMVASAHAAWRIDKTQSLPSVLLDSAGIGLLLLLAMGLAGHFSGNGPLHAEGYGFYNMNILALFDPLLGWSRYLHQYPIHPDYAFLGNFGQYEGFLYLGAGMILLLLVVLLLQLVRPQPLPRRWQPLLALAVLFWLLALSNVVTLAEHRLFTLPIADSLHRLLSVFRASGRFGWLAFYLITLGAIMLLLRQLPPRPAFIVLLVSLVLQLADQSDKHTEFRAMLDKRQSWQTPLKSPQWQLLAAQAKILVIMPPLPDMAQAYIAYAHLAAKHQLATNAAIVSHVGPEGMVSYGISVAAALQQRQYDPRIFYVFPLSGGMAAVPPDWVRHLVSLDGVSVLPPGLSL